jgi:PAS domain S-box-containing protein
MARNERRSGIERKILAAIFWVGIIPITVALIVGYGITREGQRKAVQRNLTTAAQRTASGLLLALDSRLRTVTTLSRDPQIVAVLSTGAGGGAEARQSLIERLKVEALSADDGPAVYSLFDAGGRFVDSTAPISEEERVHESWVGTVDKTRFTAFKYSSEENRYFAQTVAPIFKPGTDERIGFLCEDQGASALLNFALGRGFHGPEDEFGVDVYQVAYVSGRGGVLTFYLDDSSTPPLQSEGADSRLQAQITPPNAKESGSMRVPDYATRGTTLDVLLAYHLSIGHEDSYRVYVVVYRPAFAVFSNINQWAIYSMVGSYLAIGVFLLIAYRSVHNNIVRPLSLLNEGAQIIRQGDLELKLKIDTGDEIEELATSFNRMAQALSRNIRQLEGSEEKYRSLVTSMRDGIYQTDPEGLITFVNPAGAEIFGYDSPEDAVGHNLRELFLEEIDFARIASELAKQSFVERTRIWMKRKDGRALCVELSGNRVCDDAGALIGAEGIFRDVTAGVRLEQQARERSERISAINQIANVINSSIEAGRLHESLIVELKKLVNFDYAAVALLNEKGDGFEKRRLWPEFRSEQFATTRRDDECSCAGWVERHGRSLIVEDLPLQQPALAHEFPPETRSCLCVPLYATGRIIGTLNLGANRTLAFSRHDVEVLEEMSPHIAVAMRNARLLENLQQSLEEVTRAREKLHEVNEELKTFDEMKTNLLSNVSHELRTPLVAVMGYTDMLYNRKVGPINEAQREDLGIILRNVEKLVTLIENLLDFSRLYRGTEKLVFDTFDLVECARVSIQTIQPIADSRTITVECIPSDDKILIEGDRGKMGQVLNNLLSNGVKFNKPGGRVTVEILRKEDSVEVRVIDTGIGIPPEALDKVFTRFYQYDSSSTRKYGGTGIGLSIAQDVVRLHGSRITVTSEVGKGSIFRFSLPLKVPRPIEGEEKPAELLVPAETDFLVEIITRDRGLNLQLRDFLTLEGMDVVHATQAANAVALVHKHHPDCILVDMEPDGGSHTVLDDLLADPACASLPIVMLTSDDNLYERYRLRVASRIKHGFRKSSLLSGIHYALNQGVPVGERLGGKILCVDDDPEVLVFIAHCLETEGYVVDTCTSGEAALDRVATHEYSLVLLDVAMPGTDGWEVCRRIRNEASVAGIKIYFVTAKPIDRSTARIQEVRADGFLLKPFRSEDLLELVRGVIPAPAAKDA